MNDTSLLQCTGLWFHKEILTSVSPAFKTDRLAVSLQFLSFPSLVPNVILVCAPFRLHLLWTKGACTWKDTKGILYIANNQMRCIVLLLKVFLHCWILLFVIGNIFFRLSFLVSDSPDVSWHCCYVSHVHIITFTGMGLMDWNPKEKRTWQRTDINEENSYFLYFHLLPVASICNPSKWALGLMVMKAQ